MYFEMKKFIQKVFNEEILCNPFLENHCSVLSLCGYTNSLFILFQLKSTTFNFIILLSYTNN